jgi:hypothetical protein
VPFELDSPGDCELATSITDGLHEYLYVLLIFIPAFSALLSAVSLKRLLIRKFNVEAERFDEQIKMKYKHEHNRSNA